jgi:protein-tyrosine-phosphatase/N-acetylglutamate synthase-like GNAT family acetyltransferase
MTDKPSVLFVCVHNAGRSQMAAAYLQHLAGDRIEVRSAGSAPADQVNPAAVAAMLEDGIDMSAQTPKILTDEAVQDSDVVITMGCGDTCTFYPGKRYEDWVLDDPAGQGVDAVRPIRDEIRTRVRELIASLIPATDGDAPDGALDGALDGVELRAATPDDRPAVDGLLADNGLPLDGLDAAARVLVATNGDDLVGVAALERHGDGPDTAYLLRSVAVRPELRDRGLGVRLVTAALAVVDADHAPVALLTDTAPDFFARFGFDVVDRSALPASLGASVELQGVCAESTPAMLRSAR